MRTPILAIAFATAISMAVSLDAQQMPLAPPGKHDATLITGGAYAVDPGHTQVLFAYDHMGFTRNMGIIAEPSSGSLMIDPKAPENAKVTVTFAVANLRTGVPALDEHLMKPDFFDAEKFPTAVFTSTAVKVDGDRARIAGDLTLHGVTRQVTLDAQLMGAGTFAMMGKRAEVVGFNAQTNIKRSDFGMGMAVPLVGDDIALKIAAGFEKPLPPE